MTKDIGPLHATLTKNALRDIAAVFTCAAQGLDYRAYARWLSESRRINREALPKLPLKKENLDILFRAGMGAYFMNIYLNTDTGTHKPGSADASQAFREAVLSDTRPAIAAALEHLDNPHNLNAVRMMVLAKMDVAALAPNALTPQTLPSESELRSVLGDPPQPL